MNPQVDSSEVLGGVSLRVFMDDTTIEALAGRVLERIDAARDDGFIDVKGAGEFLGGRSAKAVYHLVESGRIRAHRVGGRLLFDRDELRADIERGE